MISFRAQFRKFRRQRHVTQAALARALGVTVRAVKYIEAGQREPRRETVEKFKAVVDRHSKAALLMKGRI